MSISVNVLSAEEAFIKAKESGQLFVVSNDERQLFFFTDRHQVPESLKHDLNWVPITLQFPIYVYPREGVETGVVDTYEKYKAVFEKNSTLVEDITHV